MVDASEMSNTNSDIFKTNHTDYSINDTSSYLDLEPLYGTNQKEQDAVRAFVDGRLKPDAFSETRVLGFPPGVSVFLVCFNRFHNYVVGELAQINEGGRFSPPVFADIKTKVQAEMPTATHDEISKEVQKRYDAAVAKRDNDLFQTGRLYHSPSTSY